MAKIFGIVVSITFEWEAYIYGWVILKGERERKRQKQTDDRTEKKEKKGEELEGKGQVLPEGRGTIGCYSVVSLIVGVRPLMY